MRSGDVRGREAAGGVVAALDLDSAVADAEFVRQSLGDLAKFERTDVEFHHILAVIPGNPIFEAIHAAIAEWLVEQRHVTLTYPGANEVAYEFHRQIYEAIASRDPEAILVRSRDLHRSIGVLDTLWV